MRKLSARWVPRLLTADHKRARVVASEQYLGMFQCNSKEYLRRYVTVDETWIHYYMQEKKISRKYGLGLANLHRKKRRRFHQPVRLWPQFFGTHMSAIAMAKLFDLHYEILHLPYSTDLAPSNYFLFPNM